MKRFVLLLTALLLAASFTASLAETETPAAESATLYTFDLNGDPFTEEYFKTNGTKVILLNLFEYWCGPCVNEMPELQKLYDAYREKGFVILGAYSDPDTDSVRSVVESLGITYPVVESCAELEQYASAYIPTSVFLSADGTPLSEQIIGARSYEAWEQLLLQYLK